MKRVRILLSKEWLELRRQRGALIGLSMLPLFFAIMPIVILFAVAQTPTGTPDPDIEAIIRRNPMFQGLSELEVGQALVGQQFSLLILLIPLIVPSVLASYSIVGEKNNRTLEPLLATPIRTWELLLAKSLSSLIPAMGLTALASAIFIIGVTITTVTPMVYSLIIGPGWLIVLIGCSPPASLIVIAATVAISSRVNDPRSAQQLAGVFVLPIVGLIFAQLFGVLVLSPLTAILIAVVLAVIAALAIWGAVEIFQRETILTRWS
jgi:ABC-2 type transport system permease protein